MSTAPRFAFAPEDDNLLAGVRMAFETLAKHTNLSAAESDVCRTVLEAFTRFPLLTDGLAVAVSIVQRQGDGHSSMDFRMDDEVYEFSTTTVAYDPAVGSDVSSLTVFTVGVGEAARGTNHPDAAAEWVTQFIQWAEADDIEVHFECNGEAVADNLGDE